MPQPAAPQYCAPESPLASPLPGAVPVPVTPVTLTTPSSSCQLTPQFGTPSKQSSASSNSNSSQFTPQMEGMKLGPG